MDAVGPRAISRPWEIPLLRAQASRRLQSRRSSDPLRASAPFPSQPNRCGSDSRRVCACPLPRFVRGQPGDKSEPRFAAGSSYQPSPAPHSTFPDNTPAAIDLQLCTTGSDSGAVPQNTQFPGNWPGRDQHRPANRMSGHRADSLDRLFGRASFGIRHRMLRRIVDERLRVVGPFQRARVRAIAAAHAPFELFDGGILVVL